MKPIIGITTSSNIKGEYYYQWKEYIEGVEQAGGIPILLPPFSSEDNIKQISSTINGLLLSGGRDIDPFYYSQEPYDLKRIDPEKDSLEMSLLPLILEKKKPVLGICRGAQVINVCMGGTLHQRIKGMKHYQEAPDDYPTHEIKIKKETKLFKILKTEKLRVNSLHYQAIDKLGKELIASAKAKDGVIEAIEHKNYPFLLGVQFHIEYLWIKYPEFSKIFKAFIESASS